jgi:3-deoxy-D-manno-octulosonic-acid transferase
MTFFWIILYNLLAVPAGFLYLQIFALFDPKIRKGILGRKLTWHNLKRFREQYPHKTVYLVHSASLGEFEQAKPVIRSLKVIRPDVLIVASFTSPSGFIHARRLAEVSLMIYLPFDSFFRTRRFIKLLKPQKIIFVAYELWPNLITNARRHHVTTYLISARIREKSSKFYPVLKHFFRELYRLLDYVYAVSERDCESVKNLTGSLQIKLLTLGDTRYDQVLDRARYSLKANPNRLFSSGFVLIGGSIWPQDARNLLPALIRVFKEFPQFRCILAPHEPNDYALEMLEDYFKRERIASVRLGKIKAYPVIERVVLVDRIGILAELYHQAQLAFIGGGFRGSVHNVMEPAVAGLPVLFGPEYHNSREAELLVQTGGGFVCEDEVGLYRNLCVFLSDSAIYERASHASRQVILDNMGASARIVKEILESD